MRLGSNWAVAWFQRAELLLLKDREELNALDFLVGDGDHGTNIHSVVARVATVVSSGANSYQNVAEVFNQAGMIFLSQASGSTSTLYGTGFIQAAKLLKSEDLGRYQSLDVLAAMVNTIEERGGAALAGKTMLDAWHGGLSSAIETVSSGGNILELWQSASSGAFLATEHLRNSPASNGKAARLGTLAIGHLDPGSVSASFLIQAAAETTLESLTSSKTRITSEADIQPTISGNESEGQDA